MSVADSTSQQTVAEAKRARFKENKEKGIAIAVDAVMEAISKLDRLEKTRRITVITAENDWLRGVREVKKNLVETNRELCLRNAAADLPEAA
jgi:20S proteasome alpha/beta subunit